MKSPTAVRLSKSIALFAIAFLLETAVGLAAERTSTDFVHSVPPRELPDVTFEDADGTALSLESLRGKLLLVNVWATWCAPCRHEMPTLDRLQARLGGPDFEVVALSIDRAGIRPIRKFYDEIGIKNLAIYIDRSMRAMRSLDARVLPTTLLVGPDGKEIARLLGAAVWDSTEIIDYLQGWIGRTKGQYRPSKTSNSSTEKEIR